ncbi:MAG: transglycosylase SLT domain-containing protein, partial [Cytophagales bacterium]|nr:transglycosylase SLT domain-containing protein [Cytophaga sp.]
MFRFIFWLCIGLNVLSASAQIFEKPKVPDVIEFAGMRLTLTAAAKRKIEADVNMIYASPKYLQQKIDRANLYFPIIERVFHEEGFPEEFKYLALQESSLISDAISSSNAVGFWQFKKESAVEVGLRVDGEVDERMHIVSASRGASKYLRKNNSMLNNWVYALLSYNVGSGGVKVHVKSKYVGETNMIIDDDMHWYVLRFLAYKTAYENVVGKASHPELVLLEYTGIKNTSLTDVSRQADVTIDLIKEYNKWCLKGHIPSDKEYIVMVPSTHAQKQIVQQKQPDPDHAADPVIAVPSNTTVQGNSTIPRTYPDIKTYSDAGAIPIFVSINRVHAIRAVKGDDINTLVLKSGISKDAFLHFNELKGNEAINAGEFYYLQLKRKKALVAFHTVEPGENIERIAQKYAVTSNSIRYNNRIGKREFIKEGRVLWLRGRRPNTTPIEYKTVYKPTVIEETKPVPVEKERSIEAAPIILKPQQDAVKPIVRDSTSAIYHKVEAGETVFALSRKYNVDSDSIRLWNKLNGYSIGLNQMLIVGFKEKATKE